MTPNSSRKSCSKNIISGNLKLLELQHFEHVRNDRAQTNIEDPSNKFLQILNMGSIFTKTMKLQFGNFQSNELETNFSFEDHPPITFELEMKK